MPSSVPVFPLLLLGAVTFQVHREPFQVGYREGSTARLRKQGSPSETQMIKFCLGLCKRQESEDLRWEGEHR